MEGVDPLDPQVWVVLVLVLSTNQLIVTMNLKGTQEVVLKGSSNENLFVVDMKPSIF